MTGDNSGVHPKGRYQGLLTFTLADRHSRRLETVFASQPTNGELLGALREFELAYRQELGVCLTCSMSVILMATETQIFKIQGGASQHVHEALRHPVPRVLSVISIFYAVLGVLLHLSASQLLCYYTLTSVERAESWRQNALRVRWLPAKLSAPHVFSAWAVIFFVASLFARTVYSIPADEHDLFYCKLSKGLLLSISLIGIASFGVAVRCHQAFERLGRLAVAV